MPKIYIASSLHNSERVKQLMQLFISYGVEISYDWTQHGQVFTKNELKQIGELETNGVFDADVLFFLQPGRAGAHIELGIMLALIKLGHKKHIIMVEEDEVEQKTFYHLDYITKFDNLEEATSHTLRILGK